MTTELLILPVEIEFVNRDDLIKRWSDGEDGTAMKIYAGKTTGDMVSWTVGAGDWSATPIAWSAEGPTGQLITGPSGTGTKEWMLSDQSDNPDKRWLKWVPGKWKIKVKIGSAESYFEQKIGWRAEDYAVIGQIVQTHTHDSAKPGNLGSAWQFRRAVAYDIKPFFVNEAECEAAAALPIAPEIFTHAWTAYWGLLRTHEDGTPQGPFTSGAAYVPIYGQVSVGEVQYGHRYWMLQTELNSAPDSPPVGETYTPTELDKVEQEKQYRIMHRDQVKFMLDHDGKIDKESVKRVGPDKHHALQGVTKAGFKLEANELYPGSPAMGPYTFPLSDGETGPQWHNNEGTNETQTSGYAEVRIGSKGRNVSWRLFGKDAPWIFTEIVDELQSDQSVLTTHRTSVDTSWQDGNIIDSDTPFNNLTIYQAQLDEDDNTVSYVQKGFLKMAGHLEDFVNSASGQWPEPEIPPSVK